MYQFPRSHRQKYQSLTNGLNRWLRLSVALTLIGMLVVMTVEFGVSARNIAAPSSQPIQAGFVQHQGHIHNEAQGKEDPSVDSFIIEMINGVATCRQATPGEVPSTLPMPGEQGVPVGDIPVKRQNGDFITSGENAADGLTINFLELSQLQNHAQRATVIAAFQRAAAVWTTKIKSPVTITMNIEYGPNSAGGNPFGENTLGSTSSGTITMDFPSTRSRLIATKSSDAELAIYNSLPASSIPTDTGNGSAIRISRSLTQPLGIFASEPNTVVATISFNDKFFFDFNPDDGVVGTDFVAVATHEIGHALGFSSSSGGSSTAPVALLDMFRLRPGATVGTFPTAQRIMSVGGEQVYFTGQIFTLGGAGVPELGLSTGGPSPGPGDGDNRQSSHWKADEFTGQYIGIMDPTISANVAKEATDNDFMAFETLGWNLVSSITPPPPPPPPANDNFANAQVITGCSGSVNGTNFNATKEAGEPTHVSGAGSRSVWYQWQAPPNSSVTITTAGSTYDTVLAVYTGTSVNALGTAVASNDDVGGTPHDVTSTVTFTANAGTIYRIAVDGFNNGGSGGDMGPIKLNWNQSSCTPPANTVQFVGSTITVGEEISTALVTVSRGDTAGAATVDYSTNDHMAARCDTVSGNASAKCDYATAGGTLRFAAGEPSKTIVLSIVNDALVEGSETLTITLTNATGTTLGSPSVVTITITDNDSDPNATNPFLNNAFFVRQQYLDFLLREPDTAGFNDWQTVLNGCGPGQGWLGSPPGCDRVHVSSGFFRSTEFGEKGYWIYRFYESALGRRPAFAEFMPEVRRLSGIMSDSEQEARRADFISRFMQLPEFTGIFSGLTDSPSDAAAFVAKLEEKARVTLPASATTESGQPPQFGRQELINRMANGQSAAQTMREFIEQKVVWDAYFFRAFVAMQYFGYLRRDPEPAGYDDWVDVLTNGRASAGIAPEDYRHLIFGFVYSVEYRERFGKQ